MYKKKITKLIFILFLTIFLTSCEDTGNVLNSFESSSLNTQTLLSSYGDGLIVDYKILAYDSFNPEIKKIGHIINLKNTGLQDIIIKEISLNSVFYIGERKIGNIDEDNFQEILSKKIENFEISKGEKINEIELISNVKKEDFLLASKELDLTFNLKIKYDFETLVFGNIKISKNDDKKNNQELYILSGLTKQSAPLKVKEIKIINDALDSFFLFEIETKKFDYYSYTPNLNFNGKDLNCQTIDFKTKKKLKNGFDKSENGNKRFLKCMYENLDNEIKIGTTYILKGNIEYEYEDISYSKIKIKKNKDWTNS